MKNNKGFVVSAVLYPLLVLFLSLIMGLISMSSTRKNILDNMKMEISDSIFDSVTCDCEEINNTLKKYSEKINNLETFVGVEKKDDDDIISLEERIKAIEEKMSGLESSFKKKLKVGDYVFLQPKSSSYTITSDMTGQNEERVINPSELNIWRVIKINADSTVDLVSDCISSTSVKSGDDFGYKKLVGTLNKIAAQYTDNKWVIATRAMGYNGQTEELTIDLKTNYYTVSTSTNTTKEQEKKGAGDEWYKNDVNLVSAVYGGLQANKVGTETTGAYWLASRYYEYENASTYTWMMRYVSTLSNKVAYSHTMYKYDTTVTPSSSYWSSYGDYGIRPIVTIKSDSLFTTGLGTKEQPYVLQ